MGINVPLPLIHHAHYIQYKYRCSHYIRINIAFQPISDNRKMYIKIGIYRARRAARAPTKAPDEPTVRPAAAPVLVAEAPVPVWVPDADPEPVVWEPEEPVREAVPEGEAPAPVPVAVGVASEPDAELPLLPLLPLLPALPVGLGVPPLEA